MALAAAISAATTKFHAAQIVPRGFDRQHQQHHQGREHGV